ncbi:MAG: hypothetical protein GY823_14095, partial [Flavobacteriaceae bacterium]|nr:hypothetical protein [Flavobacteriaceae bacterium]
ALHCTALHCTALHCTALHCTALHCTELHCTALNCTTLHCTALHCTALHCTALHSEPVAALLFGFTRFPKSDLLPYVHISILLPRIVNCNARPAGTALLVYSDTHY